MINTFATDYRIVIYSTTTRERTALPVTNSPTEEYLVAQIEVPGPIYNGEIWEMFGEIAVENPGHETNGVFIRTEIWIVDAPGEEQSGINTQILNQTASFNVGAQAEYGLINRDGRYLWDNNVVGTRWLKLFGASGSTNTGLPDTEVRNTSLGLKRIIPFGYRPE